MTFRLMKCTIPYTKFLLSKLTDTQTINYPILLRAAGMKTLDTDVQYN